MFRIELLQDCRFIEEKRRLSDITYCADSAITHSLKMCA